jgi:hypothetical protein
MEMKETKRITSFGKFLHAEMIRIDEAKYYEGEHIHNDPGPSYVMEWINQNAKDFREKWDISCCKDCKNWKECAHKVKKECERFEIDNNEE